jgi:hypothetical protein
VAARQPAATTVAGSLICGALLCGCHKEAPAPVAITPSAEERTGYIRLVNLSHKPVDFRLDGLYAAKAVRPGEASEFCILSSRAHVVEADVESGALSLQSVRIGPGVSYSWIVTEPGKFGPKLVAGEEREPIPDKVGVQAFSLTGRAVSVVIGGTSIPVSTNGIGLPATILSPGTYTWFSEGTTGTARVVPGVRITLFIGDRPGTLWFRSEFRRKLASVVLVRRPTYF